MTPERLQELRRLAEAATPGPWRLHTALLSVYAEHGLVADVCSGTTGSPNRPGPADLTASNAAYIVAAANAIPELLGELEAMQLQLQEAQAENEGLRRGLGRVAPTEYRCRKAKGWLCGLGYGHSGGCMAVNHPHPLGGD